MYIRYVTVSDFHNSYWSFCQVFLFFNHNIYNFEVKKGPHNRLNNFIKDPLLRKDFI